MKTTSPEIYNFTQNKTTLNNDNTNRQLKFEISHRTLLPKFNSSVKISSVVNNKLRTRVNSVAAIGMIIYTKSSSSSYLHANTRTKLKIPQIAAIYSGTHFWINYIRFLQLWQTHGRHRGHIADTASTRQTRHTYGRHMADTAHTWQTPGRPMADTADT